ncbi:hypothetical protein N008_01165 [Hymenobacter sp. APR13]|nr:hypothetical protein N008_01165 [Hymenobacter sp. APR13]
MSKAAGPTWLLRALATLLITIAQKTLPVGAAGPRSMKVTRWSFKQVIQAKTVTNPVKDVVPTELQQRAPRLAGSADIVQCLTGQTPLEAPASKQYIGP